ncbi:efflux RND transporter periplasmic adaptor subunit [Pinibacter aurantiacus]|uniref:efflux RND transporter periplasmic adaptor subunit n=1 Tax=Pinibacter aurantiacus TaxID=2851599 RepID=UPI001E4AA893|nr:efflux RND transporter periplasmic adaptor subunit [Pinibacter aurantiacus]
MYLLPKKLHFFCFITFSTFMVVACKDKKQEAATKDRQKSAGPAVVDIIVAAPQSISNIVEANGTVVANEYVELRPEVTGRLIYLNVPEGKFVNKGTVIARINDADLQAQIAKSKVQLDLAEKTVDRYKQLLAVNGLNQSDYDVALNQMNGYKADIAYYQALIDKTVIKAPFSGIVGLRQVSPGAYVSSTNIIATIQQLDKIKIDFTLPENYNTIIKMGGTVRVKVDENEQSDLKATIIAIEPQVTAATRNLKVRTVLQNGKPNPGAFVKVYINAGTDKKAIMVPTNCIIPDDKNKQLVLVKNGHASFVNIETGDREASNVEITKGVNPGDSVVVTGVLFARPKSPVHVRSVKTLDQLVATQ